MGPEQNSCVTVLVVDDDHCTRALLGIILERDGYIIITAEDGIEALAAFERHIPDIIITDINMPRLNGLDLIRTVRKLSGSSAATPIIALTADTEDIISEARLAGANIVGRKPTDVRRVAFLIQEIFDVQRAHRAIR
jgi:two-component system, chemotaxis family, chemotaxis protein CheY